MKTGLNAWAFPPNLTLPQSFKHAKAAGFDCVELNVSDSGQLTPDTGESAATSIRRSAENISLELRSLCSGLLWQSPLTANDPAVAERGREIVKRCLQICKWLGADTLLVIPGVVTEDVPYDVAYERSLAALKELAGYCGEDGCLYRRRERVEQVPAVAAGDAGLHGRGRQRDGRGVLRRRQRAGERLP